MREYAIPFTFTGAPGAAIPIVQVANAATTGFELLELVLGQEVSETSEQAAITIGRRTGTSSTSMTATTPVPLSPADAAAVVAAHVGISTSAGAGLTIAKRLPFNVLTGLYYVPMPEGRLRIAPGAATSFLTIQFVSAPTSATWSGHIIIGELA